MAASIHDILATVGDPKVARAFASLFESFARQCALHASILEERAATWTRPADRVTPVTMLMTYLAAGNTLDAACRTVCAQTGIAPEGLLRAYKAKSASADRAQRRKRNTGILAMAGRGYSNSDIASHTGLHPKHVSKIIRRAIRGAQRPRSLPAQAANVGVGADLTDAVGRVAELLPVVGSDRSGATPHVEVDAGRRG